MTRVAERPVVRTRRIRWIAAVGLPLAVAVIAVLAVGTARVDHESMSPTLHTGDVVLFDRWSTPVRGDIVLFDDRDGWSGVRDATLVKRVVGVAGDVVVCCDSATGRLLINGTPLAEPYVGAVRSGGSIPFHVTVPDDTVWVVGDNRDASVDSRAAVATPSRGGVGVDDLRGVVRAWWPAG